MNAQKFTKKALEAINSAQSIAIENQNMQIMPEHLLYALAHIGFPFNHNDLPPFWGCFYDITDMLDFQARKYTFNGYN